MEIGLAHFINSAGLGLELHDVSIEAKGNK